MIDEFLKSHQNDGKLKSSRRREFHVMGRTYGTPQSRWKKRLFCACLCDHARQVHRTGRQRSPATGGITKPS
jgi:hypothetical protein